MTLGTDYPVPLVDHKFARERANARDAIEVSVGRRILDFVFDGTQAEGSVTREG